jgi:putative nucleotidyltransferase with HDIG domain
VPNYIFDEKLTNEAEQAAIRKVSKNKGIVNENERIVAKHDRITPEIKDKIDSYRKAKGVQSGFWQNFAQEAGKFIHVSIIFLLLGIYIYLFRKKIYNDNLMILLILIVILLICFMGYIVSKLNVSGPVELLIFLPVASMLLTIIFDSRIGFYATVVSALLIGAIRGNDYALVVMNVVAGGLAAYTVRDIKNRNQIFRSFFFILVGYLFSIVAFGLESFASTEQLLIRSSFAATNSLLSPALTFGIIIFVEKIFGITTDLTLLELSDFNSPLLRNLARNAPGTFNHSMTIGAMVENAAEVIGANQILARIGAYYHDIGKLANPEGYVENQMDNNNLHESLDPLESAKLIIGHVTKGIELAKKNGIPQEVIDFIPMHHGTLVVTYFYEKAKEKDGEDQVVKDDYRYPGPKPNTKETALLMLADACESAVRAMEEPDLKKVTNMVSNLIQQRIDDGQLNEAPITLGDIDKIRDTFINILVGQHHKRIKYPKQDELENTSSEKTD